MKRKGLNSTEVFDDVVSKQKHYQPHYKQGRVSPEVFTIIELYIAVPNAFNGKLKITNMEWDTKLEDKSSEIFKTLRNKVENDLVRLFEEISPNSKVNIVVTGFSPGSVVVSYIVGWLSKNVIHSAIDVRKEMVHKLKEGNGKLVGQFIVAKQSIEVENVLKDCAQLGCKDECHYSYSMLQLYCGCEKGQDCVEEVIDTLRNFSDNQISEVNETYKNLSENQISDNDEVSQNLVTYSVQSKLSTTPSTIDLNGEIVKVNVEDKENRTDSRTKIGILKPVDTSDIFELRLNLRPDVSTSATTESFNDGMKEENITNSRHNIETAKHNSSEYIEKPETKQYHNHQKFSLHILGPPRNNHVFSEKEVEAGSKSRLQYNTTSTVTDEETTSTMIPNEENTTKELNDYTTIVDDSILNNPILTEEPIIDKTEKKEESKDYENDYQADNNERETVDKMFDNQLTTIASDEILRKDSVKMQTNQAKVETDTKEGLNGDIENEFEGSGLKQELDEKEIDTSSHIKSTSTNENVSMHLNKDLESEMLFIDDQEESRFGSSSIEDTNRSSIKSETQAPLEDNEGSADISLDNSTEDITNSTMEGNIFTVHLQVPTLSQNITSLETNILTLLNSSAGSYNLEKSCHSNMFCDGRCLERHQICDSLQDCTDNLDEEDCHYKTCLPEEFPCLSGRCIPAGWKCDGKPDCSTAEDEVACSASCQPGEFLCREGKCIPGVHTCDGAIDCGQGEDEVGREEIFLHDMLY